MPSQAENGGTVQAIRCVAVIGAGQHGRAFALRCAAGGFETILQDVLSSKLRKVQELLAEQADSVRENLRFASSIEDAVRDADVAIDFVPDELESKLEIFSLLDRMAPPKTIFCTPTQLSISDLASCTYRADRCVALEGLRDEPHSPVSVTRGRKTLEVVDAAVCEWLQRLGFTTVVVEDAHPAIPGVY